MIDSGKEDIMDNESAAKKMYARLKHNWKYNCLMALVAFVVAIASLAIAVFLESGVPDFWQTVKIAYNEQGSSFAGLSSGSYTVVDANRPDGAVIPRRSLSNGRTELLSADASKLPLKRGERFKVP